jgi:hypothetical protein
MAELHNKMRVVRAISPISLGATASGGKTSVVVDRNGFENVEFEVRSAPSPRPTPRCCRSSRKATSPAR